MSSPLNGLAYIDQDEERDFAVPSIVNTLNSHVPTSLGQVVEKNATGLGVRLTAYCENDDCDKILQETTEGNFELDKKRNRKIIDSNDLLVEHTHIKQKKCPRSLSIECKEKQGRLMHDKNSSATKLDVCKQDDDLIECYSNAFAIPHLPKGYTQADGRVSKFLSCKVLDNRKSQKGVVSYKVTFSNKELISAKMKKQWISCTKIMSEKNLMKQIRPILSLWSGASFDIIDLQQELAKTFKIDQMMIAKILQSMQSNGEWMGGSKASENGIELRGDDAHTVDNQKVGVATLHSNMIRNGRFSFATNPITTVI